MLFSFQREVKAIKWKRCKKWREKGEFLECRVVTTFGEIVLKHEHSDTISKKNFLQVQDRKLHSHSVCSG